MARKAKRPNLFIIGAPKCGTTSMANWLAGHPACHLPETKEPYFFTQYRRPMLTLDQYEALYANAGEEHAILLDASTDNYENVESIWRILDYQPAARFIMMLRDPVEMAYSLYQEHCKLGLIADSTFEIAWTNQEKRHEASRRVLDSDPRLFLYKERCLLGKHLKNLMHVVPENRLHLIFFDDLKRDPQMCYRNVLKFCGLAHDGREDFTTYNKGRETRYPKLNALLHKLGNIRSALGIKGGLGVASLLRDKMIMTDVRSPLPSELSRKLSEAFTEDIALLSHITGRDLSHWGKPGGI